MHSNNATNIQSLINNRKFSGYQWVVFVLCFLVVLLDGFDTAAIGYVAPSLLKEWGITRPALGPVMSAALFGLAAGAIFAGPLADRVGRKGVIEGSVMIFAVACIGSSFSESLDALTVMRFLTGVGLGAAMPNAITLMSEYCPDRNRAMITSAMFSGFPLGAAFGGFLAAWMIPLWGWRSVLVFGGVAPLVLVVVMLVFLPESIRYLVANNARIAAIRKTLARVVSAAVAADYIVIAEQAPEIGAKKGLGIILSGRYIIGSVMLWIAYFMGLVIFYSLINWMPLLLKDAGLEPKNATLVSALFPLGGCGAIFLGWLMDRTNGNRAIAGGYFLTAVFIFAIGQAVGAVSLPVVMLIVLSAGTMMNAAQVSMPALAAGFYPTQCRATGVAWMLGIGRFGGVAGSMLVAELTRRQLTFDGIFSIIAVPGVIAAGALLVKQLVHPETPIEHEAAVIEAHAHQTEAPGVGGKAE